MSVASGKQGTTCFDWAPVKTTSLHNSACASTVPQDAAAADPSTYGHANTTYACLQHLVPYCSLPCNPCLSTHPGCHWLRRGDASLLLVVLVILSVKLSWLWSSSNVLRRPLPLDCARGGRRSLPLRKSAAPDPDAPLCRQVQAQAVWLWQTLLGRHC